MSTLYQHVAKGWWFRRVVLQVGTGFSPVVWRDATPADLEAKEREERATEKYWRENPFFPRGTRVIARQSAGFHKGARGVVEFQEPSNGKVWVQRDGACGPVFYHGDELMVEDGPISSPIKVYRAIPDRPTIGDKGESWSWIVLPYNRFSEAEVARWCDDHCIPESTRYIDVVRDRERGLLNFDEWIENEYAHTVGFEKDEDATLFYLAHR